MIETRNYDTMLLEYTAKHERMVAIRREHINAYVRGADVLMDALEAEYVDLWERVKTLRKELNTLVSEGSQRFEADTGDSYAHTLPSFPGVHEQVFSSGAYHDGIVGLTRVELEDRTRRLASSNTALEMLLAKKRANEPSEVGLVAAAKATGDVA